MTRPDFGKCVRSLAATLLAQQSVLVATPRDVDAVTTHLLATQQRMPDHLRVALRAATLAFDALAYAFRGRPFHRLDPAQREALLRRLERMPIGPVRSLIGFYRALSTHALWSLAQARGLVG